MPLYRLKNHYGGVVIGGENPQDALNKLKCYENRIRSKLSVSLAVREEDLLEISPDTKGIILYFSNECDA